MANEKEEFPWEGKQGGGGGGGGRRGGSQLSGEWEEWLTLFRRYWLPVGGALLLLGIILFVTSGFVIVDRGEGVVFVRKWMAENPPSGSIIAEEGQKGIYRKPLGEGWYWRNPLLWSAIVIKKPEVPDKKVGIRVKLHGDPSEGGFQVMAGKNEKGIREEIDKPGRHLVNPWAEKLEIHDAQQVSAGEMGVVINRGGEITPENIPNEYTVSGNQRGVLGEVKDKGLYFWNPYKRQVIPVDRTIQKFEMKGENEVTFPSNDGFMISLEGWVRWRIDPAQAAEAYVRFYDIEYEKGEKHLSKKEKLLSDIEEKVILPLARAYSRVVGSRYDAAQFIRGTLDEFSDRVRTLISNDPEGMQAEFKKQLQEEPEVLQRKIDTLLHGKPDPLRDKLQKYMEISSSEFQEQFGSYLEQTDPEDLQSMFQKLVRGAREEFEENFLEKLQAKCKPLGIQVKKASINNFSFPKSRQTIDPNEERGNIIEFTKKKLESNRRRARTGRGTKLSIQDIIGIVEELQLAQKQLAEELDKIPQQEERKLENVEKERAVRIQQAKRSKETLTIQASKEKEKAMKEAEGQLRQARERLEAARERAEAIIAEAEAEAEVIQKQNQAAAIKLERERKAIGQPNIYAQYKMYEKLAPTIQSILTNTTDPLAQIFRQYTGELNTMRSDNNGEDK